MDIKENEIRKESVCKTYIYFTIHIFWNKYKMYGTQCVSPIVTVLRDIMH